MILHMKAAIAQYPILSEVEVSRQPSAQRRPQAAAEARPQDRQLAVAYVCKTAVVLSGVTMIYCLVSYGRIFQSYLQW